MHRRTLGVAIAAALPALATAQTAPQVTQRTHGHVVRNEDGWFNQFELTQKLALGGLRHTLLHGLELCANSASAGASAEACAPSRRSTPLATTSCACPASRSSTPRCSAAARPTTSSST
ncbi:hypothetical protein [Aromatoleum sp.]|uniref:hypothetical protein n=1 Tax=Aromatoleum sp. TaxID=2307007 RepID=UPI002FCB0706